MWLYRNIGENRDRLCPEVRDLETVDPRMLIETSAALCDRLLVRRRGRQHLRVNPCQRLSVWIIVEVTLHSAGAMGSKMLDIRSEEHTSELQSLMRISYAVFCLKKKKN